jgi:uncharacterized membrane protein (UPF0127 family)
MGTIVKKIGIIILIALIIIMVKWLFIPFIQRLTGDSLETMVNVEVYSDEKRPIEVGIGTTTLQMMVAVTENDRIRGLGGRMHMEEDEALLFVFEEPGYHAIWMKDMYFPIDIAWLDKQFRIIDIKSNVSPNTYPKSFRPEFPALYVLEVNAGFFKTNNIKAGELLRLVEKDKI